VPTTIIHKFSTNEPKVAFTLDDGPYHSTESNAITTRILDELSLRGVKCTFFLIGWRVKRLFQESWAFPPPAGALLARFRSEGHEVCNHTYDHPPNYPEPGDPCANKYMPDLPPTGRACSWEFTIKFFGTAVQERSSDDSINFSENVSFWRSPHFAGTDPDDPTQRSRNRPQTNQTMVDFIFDMPGSGRRPVTATAGLYMVANMSANMRGRVFANALKGKYHDPKGVIAIGHQTEEDRQFIRKFAQLARRSGLTLTTVGDVASGATGDV
jgi:hypothetical protein